MKLILFPLFILIGVITFSCKKDSTSPNTPPSPPVDTMTALPKDTLAAGWSKTLVSHSPFFFDIFFINNTGFAVSTTGIYKSTNGGNAWTEIVTGGNNISNMGMGSETNAAFALEPQKVVSTRDGGASFDTTTLSDNSISDVFYVNASTAYALGNSFWKTIDAGLNWTKVYDFPNPLPGRYQTLFFLDEQTGWATRPDGLYKTTNGGVNWQVLDEGNQVTVPQTNVVFFSSAAHGFIADFNIVAGTVDSGADWNKILTGSSNTYHDLYFLTDNIGYTTDGQYIRKTIDGGATWTKEVTVPGVTFYELHFTDANHGWGCATGGVIVKYEK